MKYRLICITKNGETYCMWVGRNTDAYDLVDLINGGKVASA
jgi:hypothetical protein